ncbi:MAG: hypothetical protein KIS67_05465 [Verrucomicrobiae bacterium]|nr:hypothetical protein [Verrucomicrobiae bacterium]
MKTSKTSARVMRSNEANRSPCSKDVPPGERTGSVRRKVTGSRAFQQTILLILMLVIVVTPPAIAQRYLPTDIVVPAGGGFQARAMNDLGQVAGRYTPPGQWAQPAVWDQGTFIVLPLLPGTVTGVARGLNNAGQVVGQCSTGTTGGEQACIWENGTVRELPAVGGTTFSRAFAINDAGTIVGQVYTGTGADPVTEAVIWKGSDVAKLVPPVAGAQSFARDIDNSGRVAVVWSTGPIYEQGNDGWGYGARWTPHVPNGTSGSMAILYAHENPASGKIADINNAGVICGESWIWYGTEGVSPSYPSWHAYQNGINDAGKIVGMLEWEGYLFAAGLWDGPNNARDLNTLLSASTPNAYPGSLWSGLAINNVGQILVEAGGGYSLLTPTSQPSTLEPPVLYSWVYEGVVRLYWMGLDSGWSYRLKRSTISGGPYTTIATITESVAGFSNNYFFDDTTAMNGVRYFYVVSAVDGLDESTDSVEVSAMSLAPPAAPSGLAATVPKKGPGVGLSWKQSTSPAIQWNRIYRSTSRGSYVQVAQINAGTSYQDNQTAPRTSYSYVVTAVNSNGLESPASNVASVRTK